MFEDYYQILGVSRDASPDEIKKAYYGLARDCHPDLHPDDTEAKSRFQRIQQALDVLGDPDRRTKYNRRYDSHFRKEPPAPPGDAQPGASSTAGPPPVAPFATVQARTRQRPRMGIEMLKIVVGGFAGIAVGAVLLWYVFGLDPLGVMAGRRNDKLPTTVQAPQPAPAQRETATPTDDNPQKADHAPLQPLTGGVPPFAVAPFDAAEASRHQQLWADYLGVPIEFTNSIGMKFRLIPPGAFMMGSPPTEEGRDPERGEDLHRVVISKPFYLSTTEITQQQYTAIGAANPSEYTGSDAAHHPVEQVTWWLAFQFCRELALKDGRFYQLPTEGEWEYACRAGTTTPYYTGDELTPSAASFGTEKTTTAVGFYPPNPFGLYDMMGSASEWCYDGFEKEFYSRSRLNDPAGPISGDLRVIRGGGFNDAKRTCRSACRFWHGIHSASNNVSFRITCPVTPADIVGFPREPSKSPEMISGFEAANLDCGASKHLVDLNRLIDSSESWVVSLEFRSKQIDDRIQCLLTWGDLRPGRDVINLSLSSKNIISGWICDCRDNSAQYFSYAITGDIVKDWTRVTVVFDRVAGRLLMFCNGKLVYADRAMVRPVLDQPSPACFGANGAGDDQRFTGQIRNFWITNVIDASSNGVFTGALRNQTVAGRALKVQE